MDKRTRQRRAEKVAKLIDKNRHTFNMRETLETADGSRPLSEQIHACGSAACIMGFVAAITHPKETDNTRRFDLEANATAWLGLSYGNAQTMFYAGDCPFSLSEIPPDLGIAVLRHYGKTGEVDWSVGQ